MDYRCFYCDSRYCSVNDPECQRPGYIHYVPGRGYVNTEQAIALGQQGRTVRWGERIRFDRLVKGTVPR